MNENANRSQKLGLLGGVQSADLFRDNVARIERRDSQQLGTSGSNTYDCNGTARTRIIAGTTYTQIRPWLNIQ